MIQLILQNTFDAVTDCTYDGSGRLTSATYRSGGVEGAVVARIHITYDEDGNMTQAYREISQ